MDEHANILIANMEPGLADTVARSLRDAGHACTCAAEPGAGLEEARSGRYDVVVTGLQPDGEHGMALLQAARRSDPNCQVVVITSRSNAAEAVAAMRSGALYYLQTPVNPVELNAVVDRAAERVSLGRDSEALRQEFARRYGFENIVGNSQPMQKVFRKIQQTSNTDVTVLIQGETGTGKELVARAIHYNSRRRSNRFVPLNCAGLVETILESELFGHEKGAFTGATQTRVGMFEYANHGTLFLDEIGDMPVSSQTKLLRVLEQGDIVRVGSNEPIPVDVRLIAATNTDLRQKMEQDTFRRDLFYRLNVVTINLPPLRDRHGDIPLLIDHFVHEFSELHGKTVRGIGPEARKVLYRSPWPGNVRELRNCIQHMIVATTDDILGADDLPDYLQEEAGRLPEGASLDALAGQPLEQLEKEHIARTLDLVDGNREKAAELLGIGERTLYRKIRKYDLS